MTMIAIDEEQYSLETVYAPGTFTYTKDKVGTRYFMLGVRTFIDPSDPKDTEKVMHCRMRSRSNSRAVVMGPRSKQSGKL